MKGESYTQVARMYINNICMTIHAILSVFGTSSVLIA